METMVDFQHRLKKSNEVWTNPNNSIMTNEEQIEEILMEASSLNIRTEVLDRAYELKKGKKSYDSASLYEQAFQEILKERE